MDDYKYEQRRKKRGGHCIMDFTDSNGVGRSCLCGCGSRTLPNKKNKTRIVKSSLKRCLEQYVKQEIEN